MFNFMFKQQNVRDSEYKEFTKNEPINSKIKTIAFYLPQFCPIAINDKNWGKGFTEWTNVSKAIPQFKGHYQPRLPGELGFYDLRLIDNQKRQIELAKNYGLNAFCYHYYWFDGKRIMDGPLNNLLDNSEELDFPFCINWANENWTKRWDGREDEVLLAQNHSEEDDINFFKSIVPILKDKRYVKINNKPLLMVYRPLLFPNPKKTSKIWRELAREYGIGELYLVLTHSFDTQNPIEIGFDAAVEFTPNNFKYKEITNKLKFYNKRFSGKVFDYDSLIKEHINKKNTKKYTSFRTIIPSWDNESRRPGRSHIFHKSKPSKFKVWMDNILEFTDKNFDKNEKIIFINAWNEWAEGAYLEPDRKFGYAYLDAIYQALKSINKC